MLIRADTRFAVANSFGIRSESLLDDSPEIGQTHRSWLRTTSGQLTFIPQQIVYPELLHASPCRFFTRLSQSFARLLTTPRGSNTPWHLARLQFSTLSTPLMMTATTA